MEKILITGSAGFIGFHLVSRLLNENFEIVGIDNLNEYYNVVLKNMRLKVHGIDVTTLNEKELVSSSLFSSYKFIKADIADYTFLVEFMKSYKFDYVINLAAQVGVRYSLVNPRAYIHSNIDGFLNILEGCRYSNVKHLIYASTSSVYGLNEKMPLHEKMTTDHPMALYAATKKSNELMAHSYSHLFNIPTTGLRFFTVYGPWGRPDMALYIFTEAIIKGLPIKVFNSGQMFRDFTYVDDIIESIFRLIRKPAKSNAAWKSISPESSTSKAPYSIYNIGNSNPISLSEYIEAIEIELGKKAIKEYLPKQDGDVFSTHADTSSLNSFINFVPGTSISFGVKMFIKWFKNYNADNIK